MTFAPRVRKHVLTAHVVSSVGWLGGVAVFLALAVAGLTVDDPERVRAAYLAMDLTAWSVLVPLALASLLTGIVQSLGSSWGLFRHYWVLVKLVITVVATAVLLAYTQTIATVAGLAAERGDVEALRTAGPLVHAAIALALLVVTTVLAVYKPRGMTKYGWRRQQELRTLSRP